VVGHVYDGEPLIYVAPSTGNATTVARYEHTVIVVGYGDDAVVGDDTVTVLDGAQTYARSLAQFLSSWGALGNMAIVAGP
jgi:uncharacterized protein YvpB